MSAMEKIIYLGNERNARQKHKIPGIVYWSDDDNAFIVEVPELPSCMADGPTVEEAIRNSELIIEEWIEISSERGLEIPAPKGRLMYA